VLCVAGLDPTGGAGLLADVAALASVSVRAAGVVTALTVQRPHGDARFVPVDAALVDQMLGALADDLPIAAIKVGMIGAGPVAHIVAKHLTRLSAKAPLVVDPVLNAGAGGSLADDETIAVLRRELLPRATLITPNIPEAEALTGLAIRSLADMERAAEQLRAAGAQYVLIKGGHLPGEPVDLLIGPGERRTWRAPRFHGGVVHGTGCALSSLAAGHLACGAAVPEAVDRAIAAVRRAIDGSWTPVPEGWRFLGSLRWPNLSRER
jgi:hydroxymethylpyrimidine/phosphomethylpyrimidine kinase